MEELKYSEQEAHLFFAKSINSLVWKLLNKTDRTESENNMMIQAAYASCYHWNYVGSGLNQQRGEWLIAHVYTILGQANEALTHAIRCWEDTEKYSDLMVDFDLGYAHEGLARAYALNGKLELAHEHFTKDHQAGLMIKDPEDKELFIGDLEGGIWFGLNNNDKG